MKTLETYLKENYERNAIDHALRAEVAADGTVSFYVHPQGVDGDTLDFVVAANQLIPKYVVDDMKAAHREDVRASSSAMLGLCKDTFIDLHAKVTARDNEIARLKAGNADSLLRASVSRRAALGKQYALLDELVETIQSRDEEIERLRGELEKLQQNNTKLTISEGDCIWWQGGNVMWTPAFRRGLQGGRCGVDYDIRIPRLGFSGVNRPDMRNTEVSHELSS